jgi:hypothetical protein
MAPVALPDPTTLVEIVVARQDCARAEQALHDVARARKADQSWSAVGTVLGTTRQAAQQRFAGSEQPPNRRDLASP